MDPKQVIQARANRKTRLARPFSNFAETFQQCKAAGEAILQGAIAPELTPLLERSAVISAVTAIEVYYRDILDYSFRYCSPDFFLPHLKQLHPEKFDITELLEMYRHQIHPLELVSSSQSFQNIDRIDRVFSKFMGKSLWDTIFKLKVRIKDSHETEVTWQREDLDGLRRTFELRHELVHDPARRSFFTQSTLSDLWSAESMVFGSDVILSGILVEKRDPTHGPAGDA